MKKIYLKTTIEIYISERDDRIIYIERDILNEKIIALNFMQGADDMEYFEEYKKNDAELLKKYEAFIKQFKPYLKEECELEIINDFFWYKINNELDNELLNN